MRTQGRIRSNTLRDLAQGDSQSVGRAAPDVSVPMTPALVPQLGPQDIRAGTITSSHMAIQQSVNFTTSSVTTSDTVNYITVLSVSLFVPDTTHCVFVWAECGWSHSVNGADAAFTIQITDGINAYTQQKITLLNAATAGKNYRANMSWSSDMATNMPLLVPGTQTLRLKARPVTAGTLTIYADSLDTPVIHCFSAGKALVIS